jgi:hypothetical protein
MATSTRARGGGLASQNRYQRPPHLEGRRRSEGDGPQPGRRAGRHHQGQHLHLRTLRPRERSPLSRGRSQGHAVLESPAPRVDGQPLGAVRARSRPVVDQEHLTIDRQRNASHAAVVTSAAAPLRPALPDGFVWPPGRVRKRGVPGAAELIAHAAPSGDQAPPSRWPRVRIPYPGPKDGNRIGRRKFRNRNEHRPDAVAQLPGCPPPRSSVRPPTSKSGRLRRGGQAEPARTSGPVIR